ncbi:mycofactocin oligosaccharide methyltransferase MftM [Nocardioides sp. CFH 31398]|uniref:mycofactocin oligosaccharide methyltransferase MftM n=1 Tax=Nocardioides sp. CFH 31398 TaxID=2919579 RepID=UPI001F065551|nr:mycofactocin oligosaccharide methyltransferase MftM [Nocardioides sp. CFH 31398]MCH1865849.1 class I SAM-dependent methyltransferase [Nocardioides sp. CFH 31398]
MTVLVPTHPGAPLDPFAPLVDGVYRDAAVEVSAQAEPRGAAGPGVVRTTHFELRPGPGRIRLTHVLGAAEVDDDLAGLLADELFAPGWLRGSETFERVFTGVVRSVDEDPVTAWTAFYRNTMAKAAAPAPGPVPDGAHGTIAGYAPVWDHALPYAAGSASVLELGSCFGFFALRLAAEGLAVTASDVSPGTVELLASIAPALGLPLQALVADAAHVGVPDSSYDTVIALHLLEHLDPDHGDRVLAEALRVARRRVVVAVPLEDVADDTWGHVRTVSLADLDAWGAATGLPYDVHEHHGGWLVVDL